MEYCLGFELLQTKTPTTHNSYDADYALDKLYDIRFWAGNGSESCFSLWNNLAREANAQTIGCYSNISAYILQILIETVRLATGNMRIDTPLPAKSLEDRRTTILDSHMLWSAAGTTLEKLADQLHLSTKQAARLVKKQYGMSFEARLTQTKLDMAVRLLTMTKLPVSEIAKTVGYSSIQYFQGDSKKNTKFLRLNIESAINSRGDYFKKSSLYGANVSSKTPFSRQTHPCIIFGTL